MRHASSATWNKPFLCSPSPQAGLQNRSNSTRSLGQVWNGQEEPKSRKCPNLSIQRRERPSSPYQLGSRIPTQQKKSALDCALDERRTLPSHYGDVIIRKSGQRATGLHLESRA